LRFPRQTVEALHACVEPLLELGSALALWQKEHAEADLAKNDRIDDHVALVAAEPLDNPRARRRLRRLTEDVGVDQILHTVSVDSDSMGTKNPFSGQASSQSTTPSFGGIAVRTSRYSPRSRRSTSNSCPGSMLSCCR